MERVCNGTFFGPAPWGSEGPKGQILLNIIKFQLQSQFQRILNQTLCVFSQMKYIKHIRRDFHSLAWVMPQGSDLGVPWGGEVEWSKKKIFPKFNQLWCVSNLHQLHMQRAQFFGPNPLGPWGGAKRSNIIKSQSQSQFQRFFNQTLFVFSQLNDFHSVAWVMPQGWELGVPWGVGGPKPVFQNSTRFGV